MSHRARRRHRLRGAFDPSKIPKMAAAKPGPITVAWSLYRFWRLRGSSAFKRQFDYPGHGCALLLWHSNHAPVRLSAITRSELIAAFAGLAGIRIEVGAAVHTIGLRGGRSLVPLIPLGLRLCSTRQDRQQCDRKRAGETHGVPFQLPPLRACVMPHAAKRITAPSWSGPWSCRRTVCAAPAWL